MAGTPSLKGLGVGDAEVSREVVGPTSRTQAKRTVAFSARILLAFLLLALAAVYASQHAHVWMHPRVLKKDYEHVKAVANAVLGVVAAATVAAVAPMLTTRVTTMDRRALSADRGNTAMAAWGDTAAVEAASADKRRVDLATLVWNIVPSPTEEQLEALTTDEPPSSALRQLVTWWASLVRLNAPGGNASACTGRNADGNIVIIAAVLVITEAEAVATLGRDAMQAIRRSGGAKHRTTTASTTEVNVYDEEHHDPDSFVIVADLPGLPVSGVALASSVETSDAPAVLALLGRHLARTAHPAANGIFVRIPETRAPIALMHAALSDAGFSPAMPAVHRLFDVKRGPGRRLLRALRRYRLKGGIVEARTTDASDLEEVARTLLAIRASTVMVGAHAGRGLMPSKHMLASVLSRDHPACATTHGGACVLVARGANGAPEAFALAATSHDGSVLRLRWYGEDRIASQKSGAGRALLAHACSIAMLRGCRLIDVGGGESGATPPGAQAAEKLGAMREPSNIATSTLPLVPGAGRKALAEHVLLVPLEKRQDDNKTQTLLLAGPSKRKATRSALTAIDKATKRAIRDVRL